MFYTNLNRKFHKGTEGEVWSSVNGTLIVLNYEILGTILGCRSTGIYLSSFKIDEKNDEVFYEIFETDDHLEIKNWYFFPNEKK